jgi:hypothetical protein
MAAPIAAPTSVSAFNVLAFVLAAGLVFQCGPKVQKGATGPCLSFLTDTEPADYDTDIGRCLSILI